MGGYKKKRYTLDGDVVVKETMKEEPPQESTTPSITPKKLPNGVIAAGAVGLVLYLVLIGGV